MSSLIIILVSYLLGAIPFGYIFSKMAGKNILEIGWRKTSGSNVFRNVGFWPGLATAVGDIGKGFLAVYLAQNLGFSPQIQALSGVAAIIGHNWSCFIKFAGGRGIGTFVGAFLALSPKILGLSFIPLFLLAVIWNSSIGTILFLLTTVILCWRTNQLGGIGLLPTISILPIFLKRLSPIKEISLNKPELIRNRLLFDDDIAHFDLKIIKLIKRLTKK